ncbi:MAG TPA: CoA transferase [Pseudolabrys sp.]|nr:CoA transferase [Pseudolabrys sp.]
MTQPLKGLLVLDFTTLLPGPLAALMLAEAGAEVIKIERPGGEDMRRFPPLVNGESAVYAILNRGKEGMMLDLKSAADRDKLKPLIARADIVIEQFRPGVMARLGLGYDDMRAINPKIIYCSISGYGQSGPRAQEAGHDINYIGATGLLDLQPGPPDAPVVPPAQVADIAGGSFPAVINILLALRARDQSGEGAYIDIAMTDAMFTFGWYALALGVGGGRFPKPGEIPVVGASPRYRLYPARDGKLVACGALEQKFWEAFCAAIGLAAELIDDKRDPQATGEAVARIIAQRPSEDWASAFAGIDCCTTIVATLEEALRDPHFVERGLFAHRLTLKGGKEMTALPVPVDAQFRDKL